MGADSKIEWTHHTFNPWRGCTKVSEGCANCYADRESKRNPGVLGIWGDAGTRVVASETMWREPVKWNKNAAEAGGRHRVFCASFADVFEDWRDPMLAGDGEALHICDECGLWRTMANICHGPNAHFPLRMCDVRRRLFNLIDATPNLDWLLLTKRPQNIQGMMRPYFPGGYIAEAAELNQEGPRPNVWLGVSVENQATADERIPELLKIPAAVRFLSCEPLLGPVSLSPYVNAAGGVTASHGIDCDWVIAGGESGPNARPCHPDWVRSLRDQCQAAGVPFFFKQWGELVPYEDDAQPPFKTSQHGDFIDAHMLPDLDTIEAGKGPWALDDGFNLYKRVGKKTAGRMLDGREWSEFPLSTQDSALRTSP